MKKSTFYLILFFLANIFGCNDDRSKAKYAFTAKVCNGKLFVEMYKIFESGAYGGDRMSIYLTDSISFRKYLGTYDNGNENIATECNADTAFVYKQIMDTTTNRFRIVNTTKYVLSDLKKGKVFE